MTKERIQFQKEVPGTREYKDMPYVNYTKSMHFRTGLFYEITDRKQIGNHYHFELWDEHGYIASYTVGKADWDENVKMLSLEEAQAELTKCQSVL
jgi:hypothetical protein